MIERKDIKLEQLDVGFERGIVALDELRVMKLGDALRLQSAQGHMEAREYERLKHKFGKDHPRTLNAAARIELGKEHIQAISIVHAGASSPMPDAGEGWAVDGFVRTANGDPIEGVTVAAYDRQERWYQELGYACTDTKGYFSMVAEKLSAKELQVYMRASKGKRLLESNEVRLAPALKSTDRVEIIIGDTGGKGDCMPPSGKGETRPPKETPGGKGQPAPSAKEAKEPGEVPAKPAESAPEKPTPAPEETAKETKGTVPTTASAPRGEQEATTLKGASGKPKKSGEKGSGSDTQKKALKKNYK